MQNLITTKISSGHKRVYHKIVSRGNLKYIYQRFDIGFLFGDKEFPPRIYFKIGKTKREDGDFMIKEAAQGYFESYPDNIREIRENLLRFEIMLRKHHDNYNPDYQLNEDVKQLVKLHRNRT